MDFVGGTVTVAVALLVVVLGRVRSDSRSTSQPDDFVQQPRTKERGRGLLTDLLAGVWVVVNVYGFLLACIPLDRIKPADIVVTAIPLLAACAALERWRWSRGAMLGIAVVILLDTACAVARTAGAMPQPWELSLLQPAVWSMVLSGFTGDSWFGALVIAFAAATAFWMSRPAVIKEFEYRKRVRTRRSQGMIASVLVFAFFGGMHHSGLSRSVGNALQARADEGNSPALRQIAFRTGPNGRPAGRK